MSATTTRTEKAKTPAGDSLRHVFPYDLNADPAAIGARAWCGYRRCRPWSGEFYNGQSGADVCVVCVELDRARYGA